MKEILLSSSRLKPMIKRMSKNIYGLSVLPSLTVTVKLKQIKYLLLIKKNFIRDYIIIARVNSFNNLLKKHDIPERIIIPKTFSVKEDNKIARLLSRFQRVFG